jgi:hypothetical protein
VIAPSGAQIPSLTPCMLLLVVVVLLLRRVCR